MTHRRSNSLLAIGFLLLAACSSSSQAPAGPQSAAEIPQGAEAVPFEIVEEATTTMSGILEQDRLVIRDHQTWSEFWSDFAAAIAPQLDAPTVDFDKHMVIAATMGQETSGGYVISVEEVAEMDGTLYAAVQETSPGPMCVNITVMTAPAVAVTVPPGTASPSTLALTITASVGTRVTSTVAVSPAEAGAISD